MFVACGIWCLADVSSVSPSSEQTALKALKDKFLNSASIGFQTLAPVNLILKIP